MTLSPEQLEVVQARDCNLLVSAAAGSGKTAVLIRRILSMITDEKNPVDVDRLLVVTFTEAAAAEMKERLHRAILEALKGDPENANLQRQSILVHHSMITTIHSFCNYILHNHFGEISLDPGFVIGEQGQMELLKHDAVEAVLDEMYEKASDFTADTVCYAGFSDEFIAYTDMYSPKVRDGRVEKDILALYEQVMSQPRPKEWLLAAVEAYLVETKEELLKKDYLRHITEDVRRTMHDFVTAYRWGIGQANTDGGPKGYLPNLTSECDAFSKMEGISDYEQMSEAFSAFTFETLGRNGKTVDKEIAASVKKMRDDVKKRCEELKKKFFFRSVEEMQKDLSEAGKMLRPLVYLTLRFMDVYAQMKRDENLIDFNDLEHLALQILVDESGAPTKVAQSYKDYFATVMTDEYQDSNEVQEVLLSAVSRDGEHPNRFMVGDMKQSIYRFRLARPEIFMEKYDRYDTDKGAKDRLINLSRNYRSRSEVLETVNNFFAALMQREVGGVVYDAAARLNPGATYPAADPDMIAPELLLYQFDPDAGETDKLGEAMMICERVKDLLANGKVTRIDKKTQEAYLDRVRYEDIAILFRSSTRGMDTVEAALKRAGIPVSTPVTEGFFSNIEVQWLLSYLEVILNPYGDVAVASVLKSPMYGLSDDELALLCTEGKEEDGAGTLLLYDKCRLSENGKVKEFLADLDEFRSMAEYESVHDLLYRISHNRGFYDHIRVLPGGESRRANVEMLLERAIDYERTQVHGLFGFLENIRRHVRYEIDMSGNAEENVESVRLMTIHKSKGLEFPICIVAGLGGGFNTRDESGAMILHPSEGIGFECGNVKRKTKKKTILQNWIGYCNRRERVGEELRVLYVAMTRAKEKLILTAAYKDCEKVVEEAYDRVTPERESAGAGKKVSVDHIVHATSFMEMILDCYGLGLPAASLPEIQILKAEDLNLSEAAHGFLRSVQRKKLEEKMEESDRSISALIKEISARGTAKYPHDKLKGLFTKTSVSDLKHAAIEEDIQTDVIFDTDKPQERIPRFRREKEEVGGAKRGSAYHRFMEVLDFSLFRDPAEEVSDLLSSECERIVSEGLMRDEETDLVSMKKVKEFLTSDLGREMIEASLRDQLHKEQPFVMEVDATRLKAEFPPEEKVLIQGIIDGYYETEDGIVLMDYKTDRVDKKEDLIPRYQVQLDLYKEALERLTGKTVKEVWIYSFAFSASVRSSL
ncbi:MAG: helicase-exonuclease AddAB subunit AddA [Lachnospiraceae bacterium]|nr:helicase-exonuclease AddAB subunit AddA [Lachnospiraceae bacterium]